MNITGLEIELPITGDVVDFAPYLTTGQSRMLQKVLISKGTFNSASGQFENVAPDTFLDMQDKAAEVLVKTIKKKDGTVVSFTKEWLDNLPAEDGAMVYEKINEITKESSLTRDAKKK